MNSFCKFTSILAVVGIVASCEETTSEVEAVADTQTTASVPTQTPQQCAIKASSCADFVSRMSSFGPALQAPATQRNAIQTATVQILSSSFVDLQNQADSNCTPATGDLREIARFDLGSGSRTMLIGDGGNVCTLVNIR